METIISYGFLRIEFRRQLSRDWNLPLLLPNHYHPRDKLLGIPRAIIKPFRGVLVLKVLMFFQSIVSILVILFLGPTDIYAQLSYYSDYFSFVGEDEKSWIAFALDTNRGQDGEEYQAEHFSVLHVEKEGWVEVKGNGPYPNTEAALELIPSSEHFRFSDNPPTALRIESPSNDLMLSIEPIQIVLTRQNNKDHYRMGSAPATLVWHGRKFEGRVIYEYIQFDNWNRLTRNYFGFWKDFHGLYLITKDPVTGKHGDFYLHTQKSEKLGKLLGLIDGFAVIDGKKLRLNNAEIEVTKNRMALGFYLWPESWVGQWRGNEGKSTLEFDFNLNHRKNFANWVTGGFAMGIVEGVIRHHRNNFEIYGIGEIIK